ncbi:hypothetical protein SESBI_05846 [Sesbania bispinosa]|nr:hypothetical protein SESBI_05846 [Sesbania bispinosa]
MPLRHVGSSKYVFENTEDHEGSNPGNLSNMEVMDHESKSQDDLSNVDRGPTSEDILTS